MLLKVSFLLILLSLSINSAPIENGTATPCTAGQILTGFSCLWKYTKLTVKMAFISDTPSNKTISSLNSTCEELKNCIESLRCGGHDEKLEELVSLTNNICGFTMYAVSEFAECSAKLGEKNSECFKSFKPQDLNKEDKDRCKNFFGTDNCLMDEITELCGEEATNKTVTHFVKILKVDGYCTEADFQ